MCSECLSSGLPGVATDAAFRTDADRHGEPKNATFWPPLQITRVFAVHPSLGELAVKLRLCGVAGAGGFTASVRAAVMFVRHQKKKAVGAVVRVVFGHKRATNTDAAFAK